MRFEPRVIFFIFVFSCGPTASEALHLSLAGPQIAAGYANSCTLGAEGHITCWGNNGEGQSLPPEGNDFVAVTTGSDHTCALESNGSVVCWGSNENGASTPPEGTFTQITAREGYTCGLDTNGGFICWGRVSVRHADADCVALSAGSLHQCGLRRDGSIACWGV